MEINKIIISLILLFAIPTAIYADNAIIDVNLVNQDPDPVVAGNTVEVRFSVENIGTDSTGNVYVEVDDSYPFEVVDDQVQTLGSLSTGQYDDNKQIVKFKLKVDKDATAGNHDIKVLAYENGNKDFAKEYEFSIEVKSEDNIEISKIDTTVLVPGQKQTVVFTISNVGTSTLSDLTFSWENDDKLILPVGADNSVHISSLDVGQSIDIPFDVIASTNADADLYNLDLTVSYKNSISGSTDSITTSAGMYIGGGTDFDIVFDEQSSGEYAFTIANIGSNDATSVTVKVPVQKGWTTTGRDSEIIGNLNKGDYTTTSFELTSVAEDSISFNVEYTDTMGHRNTISKDVIITSQTAYSGANLNSSQSTDSQTNKAPGGGMRSMTTGINQATSIAKYLGYALIVLIVATIGVIYVRKKKKKVSKK